MGSLIKNDIYLRTVIDALPSAVFVVDADFNIFDLNPIAKTMFGIDSEVVLRRLCGEIMHCMNAIESKDGCGTTDACPDCMIRNSVEAAGNGNVVYKAKYKMKIQKHDDISDVHMLVSASPFHYNDDKFILLVLEDITEIVTLKSLLPICASCKKIRNDEDYWESIADYLKEHADLEFTHSICPKCVDKLYPDMEI